MTISDYLKGKFDFKFSDLNISSVLSDRGISPEADASMVDERDKDLARADLYLILASAVGGGGRKVQKGNRSVSERSYSFGVNDRTSFRKEAERLYLKWGESFVEESPVKFLPIFDV